jgi:hypothetical protein
MNIFLSVVWNSAVYRGRCVGRGRCVDRGRCICRGRVVGLNCALVSDISHVAGVGIPDAVGHNLEVNNV